MYMCVCVCVCVCVPLERKSQLHIYFCRYRENHMGYCLILYINMIGNGNGSNGVLR